jgi:hypothetical protein
MNTEADAETCQALKVISVNFDPPKRTMNIVVDAGGFGGLHTIEGADTMYLVPEYAMNDLLDESRALEKRIEELESQLGACRDHWANLKRMLEGSDADRSRYVPRVPVAVQERQDRGYDPERLARRRCIGRAGGVLVPLSA